MKHEQAKHFCDITDELYELCDKKSKDYSDDMEKGTDNISVLGLRGIYVRMTDKMARLHKFIWLGKDNVVENDGLEDALKDLANYCIIALMVKRNLWKNC